MAFVLAIITIVFYKEKVSSSVKFQCLWKYILCLMEDLKKTKKKLKVYNLQWNVLKLYKSFWTFNVMKFASMWPHHTKGSLNNTNGWGPMLYPNYILCIWVFFLFFLFFLFFSFFCYNFLKETFILSFHFLKFKKLHAQNTHINEDCMGETYLVLPPTLIQSILGLQS